MKNMFESYGIPEDNKIRRPTEQCQSDLFSMYGLSSGKEENRDTLKDYEDLSLAETNSGLSTENCPDLVDLFSELDSLVGLKQVKQEIYQLIQFVKIQNLRRKRGLGATGLSLHSVFYGGPGTGKTTVARIYGKMLKSLGLLASGHLIETDRSGLVGNYIGQTANKTNEKINEAIGGVLFIDEAYSLYKGERASWDYGSEAIEVLMKRMEDNRNNIAVIVAGYPEPMEVFLNSNEGFKSRFANFVYFEDYSPLELVDIFLSFCHQSNYRLADDVHGVIKLIIENAHSRKDKSFGNARYCRNLFEKIIRCQALRVSETSDSPADEQLLTIEVEDVMPFLYQ